MKNNFILCALLVIMNSLSQAGTVILPSAEVLTERLAQEAFGHFIQNTNIIKQLANKELETYVVAMHIETAWHNYTKRLTLTADQRSVLDIRKPELLKIILKDNPEEVADYIKRLDEYKNKKN